MQPSYEISTGLWGRSYQDVVYVRPTDSIDVMANYFLPGFLDGDHSFKFGLKFRHDEHYTESLYGGDAYARFRNGVATEAQIGSYSYTDAPVTFDSPAGYVWWSSRSDPTNIESSINGGQFAEQSTTSGTDDVYVNAKWIARLSGSYTLPWWSINVAGFYNARDGYPFVRYVRTATRPFSAGTVDVFLDRRGDERLPNFQSLDFRVDKTFTFFGQMRVTPSRRQPRRPAHVRFRTRFRAEMAQL